MGVARAPPPPIEMLLMLKCHKKVYCFFSLSFFQHLREQRYTHTTVINNNIDPDGPGPLNIIFAKQFKWAPYNNV